MANEKKKQIRGIRILLTIFYGFLLSSTLFRYVIHGVIETIRRPTNPYAIAMIVIGILILVSIVLATYATWFDKALILMVSCGVLVFVFCLTLVFGILRIVDTAPQLTADTQRCRTDHITNQDIYALVEDIIKLAIELLFILLAVLATFALVRYIKAKYTPVPTK